MVRVETPSSAAHSALGRISHIGVIFRPLGVRSGQAGQGREGSTCFWKRRPRPRPRLKVHLQTESHTVHDDQGRVVHEFLDLRLAAEIIRTPRPEKTEKKNA
jgi:hypothetical protein